MCGRFTLYHSINEIMARFAVQETLFEASPRYNVAPTQTVPAVVQNGVRALQGFRWGLVPSWSKDITIGQKLINARSETLNEKPSFRTALKKRRCLIPADGFYEWKASESKQPYYIHRQDGGLFAFAGLWEEWHDPQEPRDAEPLRTCTIVTCAPNELMSPLHHRMAVILRPEDEALWLDPTVQDVPSLLDCLEPYEYEGMETYPIGRRVGRTDFDGPELIAPLSQEAAINDDTIVPQPRVRRTKTATSEASGSLFGAE